MKSTLLILAVVVSLTVLGFMQAQTPTQAQPQVYGRGRGGAPFAWNDKNKDGICDMTGQRVGQGRPGGFNRGVGRGRGARGWWRGGEWGRGRAMRGTAPVQPSK